MCIRRVARKVPPGRRDLQAGSRCCIAASLLSLGNIIGDRPALFAIARHACKSLLYNELRISRQLFPRPGTLFASCGLAMRTAVFAFILGILLAAAARAGETTPALVVHLASGRTFAGDLAPRTDGTQLWLQNGRGSMTVLRPIIWDRVVRASVLGQDFSGAELRQMVERVWAELPPPARPVVRASSLHRQAADLPPEGQAVGGVFPPPARVMRRVQHLRIDVAAGRWSDSAAQDGLVIRVYPLDGQGRIVPVWGSLEVDLKGWHVGNPYRPQPFFTVGQWAEKVRPEDFGSGGAVYQLPFQAVRPETDLTVADQGLVHARLSVPGQGTFDASQDAVELRPFSPVRDQLQQATGQRRFPEETR
jgi:hypothetical protein